MSENLQGYAVGLALLAGLAYRLGLFDRLRAWIVNRGSVAGRAVSGTSSLDARLAAVAEEVRLEDERARAEDAARAAAASLRATILAAGPRAGPANPPPAPAAAAPSVAGAGGPGA